MLASEARVGQRVTYGTHKPRWICRTVQPMRSDVRCKLCGAAMAKGDLVAMFGQMAASAICLAHVEPAPEGASNHAS